MVEQHDSSAKDAQIAHTARAHAVRDRRLRRLLDSCELFVLLFTEGNAWLVDAGLPEGSFFVSLHLEASTQTIWAYVAHPDFEPVPEDVQLIPDFEPVNVVRLDDRNMVYLGEHPDPIGES